MIDPTLVYTTVLNSLYASLTSVVIRRTVSEVEPNNQEPTQPADFPFLTIRDLGYSTLDSRSTSSSHKTSHSYEVVIETCGPSAAQINIIIPLLVSALRVVDPALQTALGTEFMASEFRSGQKSKVLNPGTSQPGWQFAVPLTIHTVG